MKKVAVVILNWNGIKHLKTFLPSVTQYSQGEGVEIIIADNGSTDDSVDFIQKTYPKIKILRFEKNYGFAEGYNRALAQIDAEYYLLLNSDVEVTSHWIDPMVELLEQHSEVAACQPKIRSYQNRNSFEYAGAAGGYLDRYGYPFCRGRILDHLEQDHGQYDQETEIFWATGACLLIRASLFKKFGGFDPDFMAHMEEIDLCWRIKNQGYKIRYTSQSVVYHLGGGSLPYDSPRKVFLNFRNNLMMLYKNLPTGQHSRILFLRMILDGIAAIVFLFHHQGGYFNAVLRAHYSFYSQLPNLRNKRRILEKNRTVRFHSEQIHISIIFAYYLHHYKTFTEIIERQNRK